MRERLGCRLVVAGLIAVLSIAVTRSASALPAFPGAEGFGTDTPGGRANANGAKVFVVTSTADYIAGVDPVVTGSFRWAVETPPTVAGEPRIIVFRVGGEIV